MFMRARLNKCVCLLMLPSVYLLLALVVCENYSRLSGKADTHAKDVFTELQIFTLSPVLSMVWGVYY